MNCILTFKYKDREVEGSFKYKGWEVKGLLNIEGGK